jgi:hypothetical protein
MLAKHPARAAKMHQAKPAMLVLAIAAVIGEQLKVEAL